VGGASYIVSNIVYLSFLKLSFAVLVTNVYLKESFIPGDSKKTFETNRIFEDFQANLALAGYVNKYDFAVRCLVRVYNCSSYGRSSPSVGSTAHSYGRGSDIFNTDNFYICVD
jgi:hypothetical protein